jgi:hypothetical protein
LRGLVNKKGKVATSIIPVGYFRFLVRKKSPTAMAAAVAPAPAATRIFLVLFCKRPPKKKQQKN